MSDFRPILADGTEEMIKIIFGAVFVLIWIIGGLMSATKKKPKSRTPEKSWDEIFRELSGEAPRPPQQQQPPPPPRVRMEPPPRPVQQVRRPAPQHQTMGTNPPSGPAVRKKLRRKQREAPVQVITPPIPSPRQEAAPFAVLEVATESLPLPPGDISMTEIGTGKALDAARGTPTNASMRNIHHALRPENLRHHYILTEILQPPKALRDE